MRGVRSRARPAPRRSSHVARASDFDGGDDDIIEFDAEDADLDDDVELDDRIPEEDQLLEAAARMDPSAIIETSLISDDVSTVEPTDTVSSPGQAMGPDFALDEEQFHRIPLYACDFFVRRCQDADDDVYDFSEVYVTPPASSAFSTPTVRGTLPPQPRRCSLSEWTYVTGKTMPYSSNPFHASAKEIREVTKVFLMRHLDDERASSPRFLMDYDEIYVLDGQERALRKANVQLLLPEGAPRDRKNEMLVIRDDGTSFYIIPREHQRHVDDVIAEHHWHQTRDSVEGYLRGFRDFERSNWF